jgi:hypothetical protein
MRFPFLSNKNIRLFYDRYYASKQNNQSKKNFDVVQWHVGFGFATNVKESARIRNPISKR